MATQTIQKNTYQQFGELPEPKLTGYEFLGWFTDKVGGTRIYPDTIVTKGMTHLYAHWKRISNVPGGGTSSDENLRTVIFDPNYDNSRQIKIENISPDTTYIDFPSITRNDDNYYLLGWFTGRNGGEQCTLQSILDSIKENSTSIFYAHWELHGDQDEEDALIEIVNGQEQSTISDTEGNSIQILNNYDYNSTKNE